MIFCSTKDASNQVSFLEAVYRGYASDGGLFNPLLTSLPLVPWCGDYANFAAQVLMPFVEADLGRAETIAIARRAFSFPVQWNELCRRRYQLELFHGPSASHKDFGAQFLAELLLSLPNPAGKKQCVLVASSGDAGPAAASAFCNQPDVDVLIFYPDQRISHVQQQQLSGWGENVYAFAVEGDFYACEQLVKSCLMDPDFQAAYSLITANSINVARMLSEMVYFAYSSLLCDQLHKKKMNIIIPTGSGGQLTAAFWARQLGYPIGDIVSAQNQNHSLVDYVETGCFRERPVQPTIANVMDISKPANLVRMESLYSGWEELSENLSAYSVSDSAISRSITRCFQETGAILCPHAAAAYHGLPTLNEDDGPWAIVGISHPAKYNTVIQPLIGKTADWPSSLTRFQSQPVASDTITPDLGELKERIFNTTISSTPSMS